MIIQVDERQHATILAALRYWQAMHVDAADIETIDMVLIDDIANNKGSRDPLDSYEIDALCNQINLPDAQVNYVESHGVICPFCGDVDRMEPTNDGGVYLQEDGTGFQPIKCLSCGREWRDCYALTGFEVDEEDEQPNISGGE